MAEKELMHDLHEKNEIRKDVETWQKEIDRLDTKWIRADYEVYQAALFNIEKYKFAYWANLALKNWKKAADDIIKTGSWGSMSETTLNMKKYLYNESKIKKNNPTLANRINKILKPFDDLKNEITKTNIPSLWSKYERSWLDFVINWFRTKAWNIWPNLDRIASRINTAEEKVRAKAELEISQQNTNRLLRESANELATSQNPNWERNETPTKTYLKRVWNKFVFTKESNPVKIHEVMSAFIKNKPNAKFLLDYSGCIWNDKLKDDIKRRTGNNSLQVYIQYDPDIKTYNFYNTEWEMLKGKRPYIWEWVTLMTKEAEWIVLENKRQAEIEAATNIDYSKLTNDLEKNFPEQIAALKDIKFSNGLLLYNEILHWKWRGENHPNLLRDFLVYTETRLDDIIKKHRAHTRYNRDNPIDTWSWIFKARFVTGNAKTEVSLFVKESGRWTASIPEYLYDYMSKRDSYLKDYLTQRFLSKWEALSHMERREEVVKLEDPTPAANEDERIEQERKIEEKKQLQLYWVEKILEIVSNLEEKDENTPEELADFAYHMEAIRNDIRKAPTWKRISNNSWESAVRKAQNLFVKYKSNDWSRATMTDETARKLISDILNGTSRSAIQNAASELSVNMTLFDNTSRKWVVQDILDDWTEANQNYYETKRKENFYKEIKSEKWVTIDWITYKLERHPNEKKIIYTETWDDWTIIFNLDANNDTFEVPNNNNWNIIKKRINIAESKYENKDLKEYDKEAPLKINSKEFNDCLQKICQLSYINVNEETGEIWPKANIDFIDELMACENTIVLGDDEKSLRSILIKYWIITEDIAKKDSHAYMELEEKILETIKSKREMEAKFQVSEDDMRKKYNAEIEELKRKTTLNDDEMARMAVLMWIIEDDDLLKELAEEQTETWKKTIKYCGIDNLLHEHITPYLAKHGEWIRGTNAEIYNDSKWLRWRWDWTDESCEKIGPILQDILIEVAITAVAIGIWTVTAWAWTAAVMCLRASAIWIRAANYANKARKILKLAELCAKIWKCVAKNWKFLTKLKNWRLWRSFARAKHEITGWRIINPAEELEKWRKLFFKEGRTIWDLYKAWIIEKKYGSAWMKAVWLIFEWTWFHVASTALHNAINGENLINGLNPIDNFKWYVQSIAYLWMLKFLWQPINTMTSTSMNLIMTQKFSAWQFWKAIKYIAWIWGEFWSLFATDEALNVVFEWELKEMTTEDAIHSIGMILWLRLHWHIKGKIKEIRIKKYDRNKKEITVDVWEWEMKISEKDVYENRGTEAPQRRWTSEPLNNRTNDRVVDKATQKLHEEFDQEIMSPGWIKIGEITYKLERRPNKWQNPKHKWRVVYTETWPNREVTIEVNSDTFSLPENSNWNNIRERYNTARGKYVEKNLNSTLESARNELNWEFTRDIESRTRDLEWKRNDRSALEWRKKNLSDEIDWLKSRKAQLEQQLQNISKELTIQPDISSLKDIYTIINEWNKVSIWWKKLTFIGVKWDKIVFTEWKWKTREFSSFKELQDAKANFNFDIKDRQSDRWKEQQKQFKELVEKEARTKNANEIIREYEQLQIQKTQIEQDIRDWFFRENAGRLVNRHIWIDGVEYQCTGKNTNNGKTTLDFKQSDWSNNFTISSFEQLKSRWQVNGYWDRYEVIDKETRAAWRELSKHEKENHGLLWWENWLFKGGDRYVSQKRQTLQQVDQQLKDGRINYDNAKLATSPKKVPNPEYDRIQKEIEWINTQLIEKWQELANVERNLWTSEAEISKLEQEIASLETEKDNLSRSDRWNEISNNEWEMERWKEETKRPEDIEKELDELLSNANKWNYRDIKLDWITKAKFEAWVYMEWIHRRFKNHSLKPNTKLPKEFLRKMRESLKEFKTKCRNNLSEKYKKLVDRYNEFFEKKLREEWNEVEIKEEEIDIIEKSSKTFWEYNQEFADIIRNNQNKIINLEKIENMDSFINESFKFLKEEMWIDDPNLKIKILEWTEWIDNHYDRSTNTVYFSRNFWWERQIYLKGWNKAETFWWIWHELNHYLQEVEIIKHYLKDNETINTFVKWIMKESDKEWINRYINQIDFNEPISERAIKYAKYYTEAGKDKTIFDKNWKILDHNKYRNLWYEKESFDRWDILADEYRKTTKSYKEQQRRQQKEQQRRRLREGNYSNEITNEIKKRIPDLLKIEPKSSINSEFSNNPELHQNFIKTKVLKNLINYVENITKSWENPDLIEVLRWSKEELSNISYEQRIELMNNINLYLKSVETANRFISIEKSWWVSAKELFLRAKWLDASEINKFEWNVTIEQFRNSVVFIFEKASDVQRFFWRIWNWNHFENKISWLDTIVINKENCKNAEKIWLKEEDAISRVVQHESQHAINEIFMSRDIEITYEEAMDSALTDINTVKEYALNRVKNEIIAQYTSRLFFNKLPPETITELSKWVWTKELLINPKENGPYDYFRERKNTQEGQKAREEYKKEVEKMCDYVDETLKSCKSNEEIQNMLNMFCTTDVKERKNIEDTVKSKEQQRIQQEEQQRRQQEEQQRIQQEEQQRRQQEEQQRIQREEQQRIQREEQQRRQREEQQRRQREEQQRRQQEEQQRRQREEQQRRQREEQQRNWNERPERWINTERREMSEVQRNSDVIAIWDLHGEYIALKWNMEYAWLAREVNWHLEWTWWNKKVVFQWDILADRWTNWLRIIQEIHQLREQARKQWWDIDIIVGNHDDFMISYLTWRDGVHWNWLEISMLWWQWRWLTELAKFIWKDIWDFENLYGRGTKEAILQAMRNSPEWRIILEEICNMKIVSQVDDVLYCHTNPTATMLQYLTKWNVQQNINLLNQKYQWYLRKTLLWEWNWNISLEEFNNISDIFLHTNNRPKYGSEVWLENYTEILKNNWINMISHGHNWWSWYRTKQIWWIKIIDTDYSYWHSWDYSWEHSVSVIKKEWWVNYHWDNVAYANLEYPIWSEVYVKRTAWWETKAKIEWYNPSTKEYTVRWEERWQILEKTVTSENLRNTHQERNPRKQWKEQQQREKIIKPQEIHKEYTENVKLLEHEKIDYSKRNMSEDVKEYLNNPNTCKPFFEVNIDWQQIFLTAPQRLFWMGSYVWPIWFVKVNWQYEIRYFIKSWSECLWRCCPWYCWKYISKLNEFNIDAIRPETKEWLRKNWFNHTWNFSYERTTMVDFRLWQKLDDLYYWFYQEWWKYYNRRAKFWTRLQEQPKIKADSKDENSRNNFINMAKEIDVTDDFSNLFKKGNKPAIESFRESTAEEVKNIYKKETLWIDINSFNLEKWKSYSYYHDGFDSRVTTEVYNAKLWWKDIEIFFSHTADEPNLVWMDNIQYKNQQINSYWIAAQQINAWWLTKKPMDYIEQAPKWYKWKTYFDKYMDFRPLYQESPLIKRYKELSQQYRVAA